jgi:hypothetical protein
MKQRSGEPTADTWQLCCHADELAPTVLVYLSIDGRSFETLLSHVLSTLRLELLEYQFSVTIYQLLI